MKLYRVMSLIMMLLFAATGMLFLGFPDKAIAFFNGLSPSFGMPESPTSGWGFYLVLAVGYMYLVTVLAFHDVQEPREHPFPTAPDPRQTGFPQFSLSPCTCCMPIT